MLDNETNFIEPNIEQNTDFEVSVYKKDLSNALGYSAPISDKGNIDAELKNVKISAYGSSMVLIATDMDMHLRQEIGAKIVHQGCTTVHAATLSEIVRKIPDEEVALSYKASSSKLHVITRNCNFELNSLPVKNFPYFEDIKEDEAKAAIKLPAADLVRIIDYTQFSTSQEETRYQLNGIFMQASHGHFTGVSTDSHRLSMLSLTTDDSDAEFGVIVPKKACYEIAKILRESKNIESEVMVTLSDTRVRFACKDIILLSKLIDAVYPQYSNFIPTDSEHKLIINKKLLEDAIDRVATVTLEKFRAVRFVLSQENFTLVATGETKGEAREVIDYSQEEESLCQYISDSDLRIAFNPKYLSDILSAVKEKNIEIFFNSNAEPVRIQIPGKDDCVFVIMPFRALAE